MSCLSEKGRKRKHIHRTHREKLPCLGKEKKPDPGIQRVSNKLMATSAAPRLIKVTLPKAQTRPGVSLGGRTSSMHKALDLKKEKREARTKNNTNTRKQKAKRGCSKQPGKRSHTTGESVHSCPSRSCKGRKGEKSCQLRILQPVTASFKTKAGTRSFSGKQKTEEAGHE